MYVRELLNVECVLSWAHKAKKSDVLFRKKHPLSLAATKPVCIQLQHQYSSSNTTAAVLQALAFVPVVTVYVCDWCTGAGDQKTNHSNINTSNATDIKHASSDLKPVKRSIHQQSSACSSDIYVHIIFVCPLFD